ncbi:hemerythrin domain-containing protein [Sphingomicrobium clamense]|uniref:Hemerythrin domain-containing protein n=1 Tax=Sphingomicrobium clamense TaxID=2851013 RepID=A0ABS6V402_9SPHN|nr:hemerythrin domain-containing protein [Sphingomicrobium sp. B8]MBW0144285.1 hemerythrin domain-containing protein [Sphingomicrobium sp. B8]
MAEETIFKRLKEDHDKHREMLTRMTVSQDPDDRKALFENFKVEVKAHAAAEEETLYSTMLADPDLRHDGQHSVAEHKELDDLIMKMEKLDPSSREWSEKLKKLSHDYLHHIEEEEKDMFPAAADELSRKEEVELKDKFEERKPEEYQRALEGVDEGDDRE